MLSHLPAPNWQRLLARLAWVLLLWPGPFPLVHSHGTLSNSPGGLPELAEHLGRFHPDVDVLDDVRFALHVHWVLGQDVWREAHGSELIERALVPGERVRSLIAAPPSPEDYVLVADASAGWRDAPLERDHGSRPGNFFGTFCRQLSLPERLGVMLL